MYIHMPNLNQTMGTGVNLGHAVLTAGVDEIDRAARALHGLGEYRCVAA